MKVIFFNIWHGEVMDKLTNYLVNESVSTDIFCLTEVHPDLKEKIEKILPNFEPYYTKLIETEYLNGGVEGQGIFVKKGINVENYESHKVFDINKNDVGALEIITLSKNGEASIHIGSIHGMARPGHKEDTSERIKQSEKTIELFKNKLGKVMIGGDFNLLPETKSVSLFEESGYKNLIKEFEIKTTRNKLSWDRFASGPNTFGKQYYADYVFVNNEVEIESFKVPEIEVSDHLPLVVVTKD